MKNYLLLTLLFIFGCASKTDRAVKQDEFNLINIDKNHTNTYTISGGPEIDYVNPSLALLILGGIVFIISFFPFFYGFCLSTKRKVLTFFKK